jgi:hypothetical protein
LLDIVTHSSRVGDLVVVDAKFVYDYFWTEPIRSGTKLTEVGDGVYVVEYGDGKICIAVVFKNRYAFLGRGEASSTVSIINMRPEICSVLARLYEKRPSDAKDLLTNTTARTSTSTDRSYGQNIDRDTDREGRSETDKARTYESQNDIDENNVT